MNFLSISSISFEGLFAGRVEVVDIDIRTCEVNVRIDLFSEKADTRRGITPLKLPNEMYTDYMELTITANGLTIDVKDGKLAIIFAQGRELLLNITGVVHKTGVTGGGNVKRVNETSQGRLHIDTTGEETHINILESGKSHHGVEVTATPNKITLWLKNSRGSRIAEIIAVPTDYTVPNNEEFRSPQGYYSRARTFGSYM